MFIVFAHGASEACSSYLDIFVQVSEVHPTHVLVLLAGWLGRWWRERCSHTYFQMYFRDLTIFYSTQPRGFWLEIDSDLF